MGGRARRAIGLRRWGEIPFGCVARVQARAVEREWEGLNPPRSAVGSCTAVGGSRWWPSIGYLCSAIFLLPGVYCCRGHKKNSVQKNKPSGMENPARPTVNRLQAFVLGLTRWLELQLPTTSFCGQCLKDLPRQMLSNVRSSALRRSRCAPRSRCVACRPIPRESAKLLAGGVQDLPGNARRRVRPLTRRFTAVGVAKREAPAAP